MSRHAFYRVDGWHHVPSLLDGGLLATDANVRVVENFTEGSLERTFCAGEIKIVTYTKSSLQLT